MIWVGCGLVFILLGVILMIGGIRLPWPERRRDALIMIITGYGCLCLGYWMLSWT